MIHDYNHDYSTNDQFHDRRRRWQAAAAEKVERTGGNLKRSDAGRHKGHFYRFFFLFYYRIMLDGVTIHRDADDMT